MPCDNTTFGLLSADANMHSFAARNIANVAWAFAKLMHDPGPAMIDRLGDQAISKVLGFNGQNLANTVWAFGILGHYYGESRTYIGHTSPVHLLLCSRATGLLDHISFTLLLVIICGILKLKPMLGPHVAGVRTASHKLCKILSDPAGHVLASLLYEL